MEDLDVAAQLREEKLKVKAQKKIIREYELKIVQLSNYVSALKDKDDEEFTEEESSEAIIRELMDTIQEQHKTIQKQEKALARQSEELRKYKSFNSDQQPPTLIDERPLFAAAAAATTTSQDDSEVAFLFDDIDDGVKERTECSNKSSNDLHKVYKNSQRRPSSTSTTIHKRSFAITDQTSNRTSHDNNKHMMKSNRSTHSSSNSTITSSNNDKPTFTHIKLNNNNNNNNTSRVILDQTNVNNSKLKQTVLCNSKISNTTMSNNEHKKRKIPNLDGSSSVSTTTKQLKYTVHDENKKEYAYVEHAKSKHERSKMVGNTCTCCQDYYRDDQPLRQVDTNKQLTAEERIQLHSRHRTKYEPPKTPPGFWEMDFPSFDEDFEKQ